MSMGRDEAREAEIMRRVTTGAATTERAILALAGGAVGALLGWWALPVLIVFFIAGSLIRAARRALQARLSKEGA